MIKELWLNEVKRIEIKKNLPHQSLFGHKLARCITIFMALFLIPHLQCPRKLIYNIWMVKCSQHSFFYGLQRGGVIFTDCIYCTYFWRINNTLFELFFFFLHKNISYYVFFLSLFNMRNDIIKYQWSIGWLVGHEFLELLRQPFFLNIWVGLLLTASWILYLFHWIFIILFILIAHLFVLHIPSHFCGVLGN